MTSWVKKELAKLGVSKPKGLLLPVRSPMTHQVQEVVLAADIGCSRCRKRVADAISNIDDVESMVVHVVQKKVAIAYKTFNQVP